MRKPERFDSELTFTEGLVQTLVEYLEFEGNTTESNAVFETKLANARERIAALEANPPTHDQTLAWLKGKEEEYIARRSMIAADTDLEGEDAVRMHAELLGDMDVEIAAIRSRISMLESK